jgi:hypothetical protein
MERENPMENSLIKRFDQARQQDPQLDELLRFFERIDEIYTKARQAMNPVRYESFSVSSDTISAFSGPSFLSATAVYY